MTRTDGGTGTGGVDIGVDYGAFRDAYGADWGTRLRLVSLPACALTTPALPACRIEQPLPSTNDAATHTVSAAVPLAPDAVVAADAGASGGGGDFSATSLTPSGQWSGGSSTGDFTWSYGIGTPQVPGGLQPSVSLAYSSQSVDGRTSSTSPQASWIGDGWDYSPGFVEESYGSCSDDAAGGTPATGDQCWSDATDQITLSLNGASNTLVHDDATGTWHPQGDSGETVAVSTDTANPDKEHRYFTVTTQDGTTYYFGRNQLPGWSDHGTTTTADDDPVTNSVWTARVYGNNSGEPCHAATFAASACNQAYRWNLDYVVDDHGNAMSYWYVPETGYYGADNATAPVPYTRGGYLTKIQYGQRAGKVYDTTGTPAAAQVWFDTAERCLSSASFDCAPAKLTSANAFHWPDVPFDQICASSGTCNNHGPAYFTTRWLTGIRTQILVSGAYQNVDSWTLTHTFPPPMDAKDTTTPVAWLSSITRTGLDGGSVALKPITFTGKAMVNRVDGLDGYQPLARYRMNTITTESGEVLQITYTEADCHRLNTVVLPSSPDDNYLLCYPAYWTPPGQVTPQLDWFNKYLVHSVTEQDPAGAGLPVETVYTYVGDPAWHFADDPGTKAAYRTWNQWRGYGQVETRTGSYPSVVTLQRTTYFRGMDGDKTASGTRSVQLTDTAGDDKVADKDEFAGRVFESQTFNGDGGARLVDAVSDPWESAKPTASQSRSAAGLPVLTAHMVNVASERVTTTKADGKPRTVETDYSYDQDTGLPTAVDDLGDTGLTSDDRCERTWYAADTKGNLLPAPRRVQAVAVACSATPHYPADLISDDEAFFDGASSNTAALTGPGDVTMVKRADSVAADGTPHYVTAMQFTDPATGNPAYDMYGRSLSETDALGRTTTTQYTPATGAAPAVVKVTQPRLPNQTQGFATTSKLDPARGLTLSTSDAAGYVTSSTYDALGRVTAVWEPGFSQSLGADPNTKYSYSLSNGTTPSTVTTQSLVDNGSATAYRTSVSIFDSLLRPREVQTATADGGRVITDTAYDDHGWTVKVNGPYYNGGAPDSTLVYAPDNQVATETGTFYDGAGRVTASAAYSKATETWRTTTAYPGSDRTDVTPPQGGTATSTITDARGQTVELLTYHGPTPSGPADAVTYSYDAAGHQTGQKDNDGNVWSSTYDLLGRKVSQTDPDTGTTSSTYDLAGQQLTSTDARGDTITNAYDVLGRKTAEYDTTTTATLSASNELASWTYDTLKKGLPTSSTRYDNGLAYTQKILGYDSHGWTQSTETVIPPSPDGTDPAGTYITDRTYTPTGNLHSYTDSAAGSLPSETVSYGYDAFGRPTSAGGDAGSWDYVDKLSWTEYDEPQQFSFGPSGNVVNTTYSYDEQTRRLKDQLTVTDSGRVKADDANYTYLPSGLITRISDQLETGQTDTQCFGYDYAQRLTAAWTATDACAATPSSGSAATVGGPAPYWQSWTYDATGDRKTQIDHDLTGDSADDAVSTYTDAKASGGPAHALAQVASHTPGAPVVDKNTDYTYDKAGNVSTRTTSAGIDTFTFDDEGKLTQLAQTGQSTATSYVYDADGNLLLRRDGSGSVLFLPDEEVTLKAGDSTATGVRYIAIAGMTVAVHSSAGFAYLVGDQNGTGQIEIDASTGAVTRRQYLPFGQLRTASSGWVGDRGFVGGEQDDETGLTNLGAREYDASTGRFLTPDALLSPGAPQTWNAYAYSGNDPVSSSDPSGACPADLCGIGTPKGDGSGDIITDGPVDPENPGRASCHKGKCTKGTSTSTASTKQLDNEEHAAEQKKATAHAAQEAAKKVKQSLTHQLLNLIGAVIGVDDAIDCITKGSAMGCISTLANFVPWTKVFKAIRVAGKALKIARALDKALVALKDATMLEKDAEDALAAVRSERELAKFDREVDLADELPPQPAEAAGCPVHSFLADTPVRLAGGGSKPIAKVKAGDTVLATDPQTGVTKPEKVQRVIVTHTDRDFTDLAVHSDRQPNAPPQKLTTTWHHPFWDVTHHRWTDARDLTAGTVLRQPDGTTATVTAVRSYHRRATTYDLTVTDLHSYYVLAGATPVLVHNCGGSVPRHRSVCDCANGGRPQMMRGPKPAGTGPHNLKIAEVADQVSDGEVIAGGARLPEREFATPGGFKGSRRPDILVQRADGSLYGINVGKQSMRSGAPIKREAEALQDLEGIGIEMHFVAYN
ncbi:RHS repeat-associated core domain-containing protein [Actinacidiphila sp. DG2A-62]|uniref:RHS repeat-associated core domain-containing protein n=1 Tax=Actinacidiphila sp. DG2A-62 TaxID=3108821 RepID=UPI002DBCCC48|nr:RHS repeat-associated core domain-containing protein [Actinacidiphila sp. DG2A-62]MEC3994483.1 RHS repeat-associated core domain-containing protein [Actinacidiphila sp. DG2A-62]